jgi:GntR family transcriptional regulator/MocR family aminotransferase
LRNSDTRFEIDLGLEKRGASSQALYHGLKAAIVDGRLTAGAKLPPGRESAAFFGVSRNTAVGVYAKLVFEGFVVTRHGSGTYVAEGVSGSPRVERKDGGIPDPRLSAFWLRPDTRSAMNFWRDPAEDSMRQRHALTIDFRPGMVDHRLFPFDLLRKVSADQLRGSERKAPNFKSPQGNHGNHHLRHAIRSHISLTRAVACQAGEIVVTSGAQQAFDLLARVLVSPNKTIVAVEDPGYPPMRVAFAAAGAIVLPVGVDDEGMMVETLPADVNVICLCPSHQFPLGVSMSMRRRGALIDFARRHGALIVEDDYDGEFRFDGIPLQALRTSDAADVVFYVGTFSKCMLPSLRLGFIVAPDWAMRALITAKNCLDWHCATPIQTAVAGFIQGGHLRRHVRKMLSIYKRRRQLLLESIRDELGEWLTPIASFYGMHVAAVAHSSVDLDRVTEESLQEDVKLHTISRYYLGPQTRQGLIFGYGTVGLSEIASGISRLRDALRS